MAASQARQLCGTGRARQRRGDHLFLKFTTVYYFDPIRAGRFHVMRNQNFTSKHMTWTCITLLWLAAEHQVADGAKEEPERCTDTVIIGIGFFIQHWMAP